MKPLLTLTALILLSLFACTPTEPSKQEPVKLDSLHTDNHVDKINLDTTYLPAKLNDSTKTDTTVKQ